MNFLNLETAKKLIGKKIKVNYPGYADQGGCKIFTLGSIESEFERAQKDTTVQAPYLTRAEYWKDVLSKERFEETKKRFSLITKEGKDTYIKITQYENCFWCGDSDRYITYEVICK